jgi:Protein of unknown function (DUF2971)
MGPFGPSIELTRLTRHAVAEVFRGKGAIMPSFDVKGVHTWLICQRSFIGTGPLTCYSREDVERILVHGQIRFSSPEWFNDPFDCRLPPVIKGTEAEKRRWLEDSYVPTIYPSLSFAERAQAVQKLMPEVNDLLKQHVEYTQRKLIPNSGVLSLSEIPDDILIWSHYADSHRGVCLKFDRSKLKFVQVFQEHYGEPYHGRIIPVGTKNRLSRPRLTTRSPSRRSGWLETPGRRGAPAFLRSRDTGATNVSGVYSYLHQEM